MFVALLILSAPKEFVLGFDNQVPLAELAASGVAVLKLRERPLPYAVIRAEEGESVECLTDWLPGLVFLEPRGLAWVHFTPNDPLYSSQWGLPAIKADSAWDLEMGELSVKLAMIDQGIQ